MPPSCDNICAALLSSASFNHTVRPLVLLIGPRLQRNAKCPEPAISTTKPLPVKGIVRELTHNSQKRETRCAYGHNCVSVFHSSFNARGQLVYFKRLSEQAHGTRNGGLGLQVCVRTCRD